LQVSVTLKAAAVVLWTICHHPVIFHVIKLLGDTRPKILFPPMTSWMMFHPEKEEHQDQQLSHLVKFYFYRIWYVCGIYEL